MGGTVMVPSHERPLQVYRQQIGGLIVGGTFDAQLDSIETAVQDRRRIKKAEAVKAVHEAFGPNATVHNG